MVGMDGCCALPKGGDFWQKVRPAPDDQVIFGSVASRGCSSLEVVVRQRDEHFQKCGKMFISLPKRCLQFSARGGRLLADELKINLLGVVSVESDQLIIVWGLGELYDRVGYVVTVEGVAHGSQFGLKLLPKQ